MKRFSESLYLDNEYTYPHLNFLPSIHGYVHEDEVARPALLIVPGGGYSVVSPTEGEIVAKRFYELGFQTFVLTYTTNLLSQKPLYWQLAEDLARAMLYIKRNATHLFVQQDCVALAGFSAGGHLCGTYMNHYQNERFTKLLEVNENTQHLKPDAVILGYPVIKIGYFLDEAKQNKLFDSETAIELAYSFSVEKNIHKGSPPIFIWHTMTDQLVSADHSLALAAACLKEGIECELHIFPKGGHGMSVATEAWANGDFGEGFYTLYQFYDAFKMMYLKAPTSLPNGIVINREMDFQEFMIKNENFLGQRPVQFKDDVIAEWPEMGANFLNRVWKNDE